MHIVSKQVLATFLSCAAFAALSTAAVASDTPAAPAYYQVPKNAPGYIRKAVDAPRPPLDMSADKNRKPAELLMLSGIKPGDKVVEFASFGQYFTTLFSSIVGPKGHVYMYDLPYTEARSGAKSRAFVAAHPNSTYELVDYNAVKLPQNVDIVFNVLYYHDLPLNNIDTASLNKRIFEALKPGGVYFIVDHNAAPGSGTRDTKALHRIDPEVIKKEVTAAGFKLAEESKLLAHPDDDHTKMVFTPGVRRLTDQSVFKFVKPKK
jgi:predicted methyltransferase